MIGNLIVVVGQSNGQNYGTLGLPFPGAAQELVGGYYRNAWFDQDDLTPTTTPNDGHLVPASVVTAGLRAFTKDMAISP